MRENERECNLERYSPDLASNVEVLHALPPMQAEAAFSRGDYERAASFFAKVRCLVLNMVRCHVVHIYFKAIAQSCHLLRGLFLPVREGD